MEDTVAVVPTEKEGKKKPYKHTENQIKINNKLTNVGFSKSITPKVISMIRIRR